MSYDIAYMQKLIQIIHMNLPTKQKRSYGINLQLLGEGVGGEGCFGLRGAHY